MTNLTVEAARKIILRHLILMRKWGESHTHYKHMLSAMPKHERGSREVRRAVKELINESKILVKKTTGDDHVSLNPRLSQEIKQEVINQKMYIDIQKRNIYIGGDSDE